MDRSGKILTTFGFEKCKRMTKIKHRKKPNQRSDGLENKTEQRLTLQKWYSMSLPSSFLYLNLYDSAFISENRCFLYLLVEDATSKKHIDFLLFC